MQAQPPARLCPFSAILATLFYRIIKNMSILHRRMGAIILHMAAAILPGQSIVSGFDERSEMW